MKKMSLFWKYGAQRTVYVVGQQSQANITMLLMATMAVFGDAMEDHPNGLLGLDLPHKAIL